MIHHMDLASDDCLRQACVLDAYGDTYDPATVALEEARATRMLYSDLDAGQLQTLDELRKAHVLT